MPPRPQPARPQKRRGYWYLSRRVPDEFKHVDARSLIQISTGIRVADDPRGIRAAEAVRRLDAALANEWSLKAAGRDPDAQARYESAVDGARQFGFSYLPAAQAAPSLPLEDLLERFAAIAAGNRAESDETVAAVLGGVEAPEFRVRDLVDEFEAINGAALARKSERQRRRWRTDREAALAAFVSVVGGGSDAEIAHP